MTNQELQALVEKISHDSFRQPFRHNARFNRRLKTTGGRYHLKSHDLDFNPILFEKYGEVELIKVIKHELCHYHLHLICSKTCGSHISSISVSKMPSRN